MPYYKQVIPLKPYVAKYVRSLYNDPFILTNTNYLGVIIYSILQKKNALNLNLKYEAKRYDLLTDSITIMIPDHLVHSYKTGHIIDPQHAISINHLIEAKINEEIFAWCTAYSHHKYQIKKAIEAFCDHHTINIEHDISTDAIIKSYQRAKSATNKRLRKNPPPLSVFLS